MKPLEIVAEIAQGFEGKPDLAMRLLEAAAAAGADAVKFHLVYADELSIPGYQYYDLFKTLEMPEEVWANLRAAAAKRKIAFYLDILGEKGLAMAERWSVDGVKIHSTDMLNIHLLERVAASKIDFVILSLSGSFRSEIEEALRVFAGKRLALFHGFQGYPTPIDTNQISRVAYLAHSYADPSKDRIEAGFADHVPANDPLRFTLPAAAIGAGARYIEKHLTLASVMKLEDSESALNPDEFARFVREMKQCDSAMGAVDAGSEQFGMHEKELAYRKMTHKHVVSIVALKSGDTLTPDKVTLKRTAAKNPIMDVRLVYGKRVRAPLGPNMPVTEELLEVSR